MPSNITPPRVPLTDPRTGNITREWYQFFFSLFNLTGAGQNSVSLTDVVAEITALQVAQEPASGDALADLVTEMTKTVEGVQQEPPAPVHVAPTVLTGKATLDFPNTAAGACSDLTMSVPGAVVGDVVCLGVPNASVPANGSFFPWVSAADTVTVRFTNNSAGALDPASGEFRVTVTRF